MSENIEQNKYNGTWANLEEIGYNNHSLLYLDNDKNHSINIYTCFAQEIAKRWNTYEEIKNKHGIITTEAFDEFCEENAELKAKVKDLSTENSNLKKQRKIGSITIKEQYDQTFEDANTISTLEQQIKEMEHSIDEIKQKNNHLKDM